MLRVFRTETKIKLTSLIPLYSLSYDASLLAHAMVMTRQALIKYVLAQGDMWIIGWMAPLREQGVYAIVTSYGSLICRLLLQPMEEAAVVLFSQSLSREACSGKDDSELRLQRRFALEYFQILIKIDQLLGMGAVCFGASLTHAFTHFVLGSRWEGVAMPLSTYCWLIPVMAISGVLEAFMHATMGGPWLVKLQYANLIATLTYVVAAVPLTHMLGPIGLILGSCVNFLVRASVAGGYLRSWLRDRELHMDQLLFMWPTYIAFTGAALVNMTIGQLAMSMWMHVVLILLNLFVVLVLFYFTEQQFIQEILSLYYCREKQE